MHRNGFTLIELLVVIAIIAMVVSVMVIQFGVYRTRVRDVQRERNMKELQKALELYVTAKRVFPEGIGIIITGTDQVSVALVDADTIPVVESDPLNSGSFVYTYDSPSGKTYTVSYVLETDSIPGKMKGPQIITP
ncbi:MAG: prepilin-type N-terminal cleavage/methylation domain-containing protein [Candidatus Sungiibacteriota bacterium]